MDQTSIRTLSVLSNLSDSQDAARHVARLVAIVRFLRRRTVNQRRELRALGNAYAEECLVSDIMRRELAELRTRLAERQDQACARYWESRRVEFRRPNPIARFIAGVAEIMR